MAEPKVTLHRWTRTEYDRMVAAGVFHPEARLELVEGEIVTMTPQGSVHATVTQLLNEALRGVFDQGFTIRVQMPLALDEGSEPEPDIAVVRGTPRDYLAAHPHAAVLVVEVADTSLGFDRIRKKRIYARAGVRDFWILDVNAARLEVYRDPVADDYGSKATFKAGDRVRPLAVNGHLEVSGLLP